MDSNMDFTMQHANHHRSQYHHQSNSVSSGSASRCPALRTAAEQRNYQLPTLPPARGAAQYDPVHSHPASRNVWQSRTPQNWRPAMVSSSFNQDSLMMGTFPGPASSSQQSQSDQPCPMANIPHMQNASDPYPQPMPPYHQYRPTMHPVPRLLAQPAYQGSGYAGSGNPNHLNAQHFPNRSTHLADPGLSSSPSINSMSMGQSQASSANQTTPFNENTNPGSGPHLPNIPHLFAHQNHSAPFSQQSPQSLAQITASVEPNAARPASNSFSSSSTPAHQRNTDQPNRMVNPVEIRRASTAAMNRARRSMPRLTTQPNDWLGENTIVFRRGDMSLMEFMENYPGVIADMEVPMSAHRWIRANAPGKRVASKQALASLQSVNLADLPESERTCVICYNEFGVANPEGINEAPLRLPKCRHIFGDHCIKKWFQESDSCPYCRDQVHSEFQPMPSRRGHPGFRFITPYQLSPQHLPGFQGHDQHLSRDRDTSESETSTQPEQSAPDNMTDNSSIPPSDAGPNARQSSGRRFENNYHHSARIPSWNERRSPPVEFDRRRRSRHRARIISSSRPGAFGGPSSNGASQASVRPSRSSRSRSRSPFDPTSAGVDLGNRRSLTNNAEQYHWNDSPSPTSNYRVGATTSGPSGPSGPSVFDSSSFPFQPQTSAIPDDFFRDFIRPNPHAPPANEQPSVLQRVHSIGRFSSPSDGSSDDYAAAPGPAGSNQFTSYQQS